MGLGFRVVSVALYPCILALSVSLSPSVCVSAVLHHPVGQFPKVRATLFYPYPKPENPTRSFRAAIVMIMLAIIIIMIVIMIKLVLVLSFLFFRLL